MALGVETRSAIIKSLDHRVLPNSQGKVGEDDGQAIEQRFFSNPVLCVTTFNKRSHIHGRVQGPDCNR